MRTKQLSFTLENFTPNAAQFMKGYIDANDMTQVLHDMGEIWRKTYAPELSEKDFWEKVAQSAPNDRFGRTCITVYDNGVATNIVDDINGRPNVSSK